MFYVLVATLLIVCGCWIYNLTEQNVSLHHALRRYSSITSQEEVEIQLNQDIQNKQIQANHLEDACNALTGRVQELQSQLSHFSEEVELQSFGFYEPQYNFISSDDYRSQLKEIKAKQKRMIKEDIAVFCPVDWTVGESKKEGQKLIKNFKRLILIIFNTECGDSIRRVKPERFEKSQSEIENQFKILNRSSQVVQCSINPDYFNLKIIELQLQYEMECKRQEERELALQIKQQEQDQRKLEKAELEMREAEEREQKYQEEIDEIRLKLESNYQKELNLALGEKEKYQEKLEQLELLVKEAQVDREAAEVRSRMIKAGHIFVVSNIGSFGRDIYRICATRSIDEDSYISVMKPVVPFPFDIHFKFFSGDVNETLRLLHENFQDRRVNTANLRRDFFHVSFEEIVDAINAVRQQTGNLKNFTIEEKVPNAYEYRKTQQQKGRQNEAAA